MENPKQTSTSQDPTEVTQESPGAQRSGIDEDDFDDETVTNIWDTKTVSELLREDASTVSGKHESELTESTGVTQKHGKGVLRSLNFRVK